MVGYYALSSRLPYPVTTLAALVERQLAGPPPPLVSVAPHVPRALARTIDRCLSPLPTARFQTGEELAEALEQLGALSSDLPAPFRVWLAKAERPRGTVVLLSVLWGLPMLAWVGIGLVSGTPGIGGAVATILLLAGMPWAIYGGARLFQTRRLLQVGYTHADIVRALEQYGERRREDLAFEYGPRANLVGRLLRGLTWISGGVAVGCIALALFAGSAGGSGFLGFAAAALLLTGGGYSLRRMMPGSGLMPRDRWVEFALKAWKSRFGRWMTTIAGWRLAPQAGPDQLLHRPTEVALGDAAEALFRALPAAERRDLKAMPEQIHFLSSQAQLLRRRLEELDDLIAQAAPTTLFEGERAAGDGGAKELCEARDLWAARLRETVTCWRRCASACSSCTRAAS